MIFDQNYAKQVTMEYGNKREWWTARLHHISAHVYMNTDTTWKWKVNNMTSLNSWHTRFEAQSACKAKVISMIRIMQNEVES